MKKIKAILEPSRKCVLWAHRKNKDCANNQLCLINVFESQVSKKQRMSSAIVWEAREYKNFDYFSFILQPSHRKIYSHEAKNKKILL